MRPKCAVPSHVGLEPRCAEPRHAEPCWAELRYVEPGCAELVLSRAKPYKVGLNFPVSTLLQLRLSIVVLCMCTIVHTSGVGTPPPPPPPVGQKKSAKKAPKLNQRWGWPGRMTKGPWRPQGPQDEPGLRRFPMRRTGPPRCAPKRRCPPAAGRATTRQRPGIQTRRVSRIDYAHGPPLGATGWTLGGTGWICNPHSPKVPPFQKRHCMPDCTVVHGCI